MEQPHSDDEGSTPPARQKTKAPRILSCVQCQHRKIKCDRESPCANCIRSRLHCTAASNVRGRGGRRRRNDRIFLERIRHYESLLRRHNIGFEPFKEETASVPHSQNQQNTPIGNVVNSDQPLSPSPSTHSESISGARNLWRAMNQRPSAQAYEEYSSDSDKDDIVRETDIQDAWQEMTVNDSLLFGVRDSFVNIISLHPSQTDTFKLWQLFMENVNPMLQAVHAPTLQKRIIDATSNLSAADPDLIALMFSVYCMAILCMPKEQCLSTFGTSQEYLLIRYQFGCQQALLEANFHRTTNIDCLAALYLYLLSLKTEAHSASLCHMIAVAVRLAQRMGLHNETLNSSPKYSPFEAELRRRLWWCIVLYDYRMCEITHLQLSGMDPTWDCKVPMNVNDNDLRPEMKEAPLAREGVTDATAAVIRAEMADFLRHTSFYLEFVNPAFKTLVTPAARPFGDDVSALSTAIESKYLRHCNPETPVQFLTFWSTRVALAKMGMQKHYVTIAHRPSSPRSVHDEGMTCALTMISCDTKISASPLAQYFQWYILLHFVFPAWMYAMQHLRRVPDCVCAGDAWQILSANYEGHISDFHSYENPFYRLFMRMCNAAWEAGIEKAVGKGVTPLSPPVMIVHMKAEMARFNLEQQGDAAMGMGDLSLKPDLNFDAFLQSTGPGGGGAGMMQTTLQQDVDQNVIDLESAAYASLW